MSAQALAIETDVLVIGGSLAGAWAALSARQAGARVVVVDKGWIGSAGIVAAATGGGYFLLPDDPDQRARTITIRHDQAEGFDDLAFCEKVYEQSYRCYRQLAEWGFRAGRMGSFRGPDSMVFLRRQLLKMGVKVLDHSPALDLLAAADGSMAGARGVHRKTGQPWEIRSAAVILATGAMPFAPARWARAVRPATAICWRPRRARGRWAWSFPATTVLWPGAVPAPRGDVSPLWPDL
jgi:succinate dehydrogenase/fumarate reductase flavoprotein subunit